MKGSMASAKKRRENSLIKRSSKGENLKNSKEYARIFDALYQTNFTEKYHPKIGELGEMPDILSD